MAFNNLEPIKELSPEDSKLVRKGWSNYMALNWSSQDVSGENADINPPPEKTVFSSLIKKFLTLSL